MVFYGYWWFLMVFDGFWWFLYPKKSVLKTSENIWTLELLLFTGSNFCAIHGSEVHTSSVMAPGFGRRIHQSKMGHQSDLATELLQTSFMWSNSDLWALMNNTSITINSH
jgi:hypothetical protein